MATGSESVVVLSPELFYGERVQTDPDLVYLACTADVTEERDLLQDPIVFGTLAPLPGDLGRRRVRARLGGIQARPGVLGHFLRAAFGQKWYDGAEVVGRRFTAGTAMTPNTHRFIPGSFPFSAEAPLPPYTLYVRQGATGANPGDSLDSQLLRVMIGSQLTSLTFRQGIDGSADFDAEFIGSEVESEGPTDRAAGTVLAGIPAFDAAAGVPTEGRFLYRHLGVTRDSVTPYAYVEQVELSISNNLEYEFAFDRTNPEEAQAIARGGAFEIRVTMTLNFRGEGLRTYTEDFREGESQAWEFLWQLGAGADLRALEMKLPSLLLANWGAPIGGAGRITINASGPGQHDSGATADDAVSSPPFYATPRFSTSERTPRVTGGSGTGAAIDTFAVNAQGQITTVGWAAGSTGYETGDVLTFTQGLAVGTYTLLAADRNAMGVLVNLTAKTIAAAAITTVETNGSGTGATIASIAVDAQGRITTVTWDSGGTGYATGDELTFHQGALTGDYTLLAADTTAGVLQNLASKTIAADNLAGTAGYALQVELQNDQGDYSVI